MRKGTKTKGLPFQSVQFQFMASSMRLIMEDSTMLADAKKDAIVEQMHKINRAAFANAMFWLAQCEDGEFTKKE